AHPGASGGHAGPEGRRARPDLHLRGGRTGRGCGGGEVSNRALNDDADRLWAERFWTAGYRADVPKTIDDDLAKWSSVAQLFEADATRFSQRAGFVSMGSGMTYGRALSEAKAFAAWLQSAGVKP